MCCMKPCLLLCLTGRIWAIILILVLGGCLSQPRARFLPGGVDTPVPTAMSALRPVPTFTPARIAPAPASSTHADRQVLEIFYRGMNGADWWGGDHNWMSAAPLTSWYGVETDAQGHVTALKLAYFGLQGSLPPKPGTLQELHTLDLSRNDLY